MYRLLLLGLLLLLLQACGNGVSEEQQVIAAIRNMEAAAEDGDRSEFIQHVAEDFHGQSGLNRDYLKALLLRQLNRYQRVRAQLGPIHVSVYATEPMKATAEFKALLLGGGSWLPESGQWYQFNTGWRKQGNTWLLATADWEPVIN